LASQRVHTFLVDVAEWIEAGKEQRETSRPKRKYAARDLVSKSLDKIWSKMRGERRIEDLDLHRLHKLRLRAKRMRYTIDFTRSLYDNESNPKRVERLLRGLGKLQSALGTLNDIASAKAILDRIAVQPRAEHQNGKVTISSGLSTTIVGNQKIQKSKQLKKAAKAFGKLEIIKPFWTYPLGIDCRSGVALVQI
jgi:triphosphatase